VYVLISVTVAEAIWAAVVVEVIAAIFATPKKARKSGIKGR
jgi:hypothetical protein